MHRYAHLGMSVLISLCRDDKKGESQEIIFSQNGKDIKYNIQIVNVTGT